MQKFGDGPPEKGDAQSRRAFLRSSGALAGAVAVTIGLPAAAGASKAREPGAEAIDTPTTDAPSEPVMAYVHDAERGEVTIMAGTDEMTYRDPVLVKRLLAGANRKGL